MDLKFLLFFVFFLLWYVVFKGLDQLIVKGLSYDIDKRYLHIRMVVIGILFMLLTSNEVVSEFAVLLVDRILNIRIVSSVLNMIMPNRSYEIIYLIICNLVLNLDEILFLLRLFLILLLIGDFDFEVGVGAFSKQLVQNSFLLLFVMA